MVEGVEEDGLVELVVELVDELVVDEVELVEVVSEGDVVVVLEMLLMVPAIALIKIVPASFGV